MKTNQGQPESNGYNNDIGMAYIREAGCGIRYIINLEDVDEEQFEVELDREQAEKLYVVLAGMLDQTVPVKQNTPVVPPSNPFYAPPPWASGSVTFPPQQTMWPNGWVKPLWMR